MLSIVYWLYRDAQNDRGFRVEQVNAQLPMLAKHCGVPFRVVCVTDMRDGLDRRIEVVSPPVKDDGPMAALALAAPRCYRRLWNWSREARAALGERILALDIDTVLLRDITPLIERPEDLVVWRYHGIVMGGAYLLRTGTHPEVWEQFDFTRSPVQLAERHYRPSDQGWLNYALPRDTPVWDEGLHLLVRQNADEPPPESARLVSFGGVPKPWSRDAEKRYPWLAAHYSVSG